MSDLKIEKVYDSICHIKDIHFPATVSVKSFCTPLYGHNIFNMAPVFYNFSILRSHLV